MKKKILFSVFALSTFMISCNEDNHEMTNETLKTESVQKNAKFAKLSQSEKEKVATEFFKQLGHNNSTENKVRGFCHPFKVKGKLFGIEVETTINICCTTLTMNCTPVPNTIINHRSSSGEPIIEEFEITDSSIYENEDGTKIRIKRGVYDVSSGCVQFELEEIK